MATPTAELSSRVPRRAKQVLDRLVGSRSMTQEGMEWLICATDPFHDDRVRNPGYPDLSTVNSVVQTYTTTYSASAPTGQAAPWDLHVPFLPFSPGFDVLNGSQAYNQVSEATGRITGNGTNFSLYPGFNIITSPVAGTDWYSTSNVSSMVSVGAVAIPPKFFSGHSRLIGAAMEVVNTTADLYKGGALTVYRAPSCVEQFQALTPITYTFDESQKRVSAPFATAYLPFQFESISLPPTTQAEAALYTDARTWAAEDGCYVVIPQVNLDNPFRSMGPSNVMFRKTVDFTTLYNAYNGSTTFPIWTTAELPFSSDTSTSGRGYHALPFETCGAILTGLHQSSTIQVTVKYFFERIPSTVEADILGMAQVPPAFDGIAMEIYSRCLSQMPVGVPVNENPLGEWFTGILETVANVAPKIGNFVSNLGNAISMVGGQPSSVSNATPQRKMTPKQKQQQKASLPKGPPPSYAQATGMSKSKVKRLKKKARQQA